MFISFNFGTAFMFMHLSFDDTFIYHSHPNLLQRKCIAFLISILVCQSFCLSLCLCLLIYPYVQYTELQRTCTLSFHMKSSNKSSHHTSLFDNLKLMFKIHDGLGNILNFTLNFFCLFGVMNRA